MTSGSPRQCGKTTLAQHVGRKRGYRDKEDAQVDIVLDRGAGGIAGVEVKASATVTASDSRGLRRHREAVGPRFAAGVVLYDGEARVPFGDGLFAVPVRALWESS